MQPQEPQDNFGQQGVQPQVPSASGPGNFSAQQPVQPQLQEVPAPQPYQQAPGVSQQQPVPQLSPQPQVPADDGQLPAQQPQSNTPQPQPWQQQPVQQQQSAPANFNPGQQAAPMQQHPVPQPQGSLEPQQQAAPMQQNMAQQPPVPSYQPAPQQGFAYPDAPKKSKIKKVLLIAFGSLVAIATLALGLFSFYGDRISYSELERTTTTSTLTENISILHPVEMQSRSVDEFSIQLEHMNDETGGIFSQVYIESIFLGAQLMPIWQEELTEGFMDSNSDLYKEFIRELNEQVYLDDRENVKIGDFEKIDNGEIKSALMTDISFDVPSAGNSDEFGPVKGKLAYIFGEEIIFVVSVAALEDIYERNESIFEEMIYNIETEI